MFLSIREAVSCGAAEPGTVVRIQPSRADQDRGDFHQDFVKAASSCALLCAVIRDGEPAQLDVGPTPEGASVRAWSELRRVRSEARSPDGVAPLARGEPHVP